MAREVCYNSAMDESWNLIKTRLVMSGSVNGKVKTDGDTERSRDAQIDSETVYSPVWM